MKESTKQRKQRIRATEKIRKQEVAKRKKAYESTRVVVSQSVNKKKIIKELNKDTPIANVNRTMDYIKNNPNLNSNSNLGLQTKSVMDMLTGNSKLKYEAGKDYGNFEIDSEWNGNISTLIGNVKFKDLGGNDLAGKYLNRIAESGWGDEERHEEHLVKAAHTRWNQNVKDDWFSGVDNKTMELIEQIMNSSDMWSIIASDRMANTKNYRHSYESSQVEQEWNNLTKDVSKMFEAGTNSSKIKKGDIDVLKRMVSNHEDYDKIVDYVNNLLEEYSK